MRVRRWAFGLPVCALLLVAVSCTDWAVWDDLFERSDVAGSRGWTGGDGAISVQLPGAGNRTLWIFGDSNVTGWDAATGERIVENPLADAVFGTTIAIQNDSNVINPQPSSVRFYARENNAGRAIADITTGATGSFGAFFDHAMLGVSRPSGAYLWPQGGLCVGCDDADATNDRVVLAFMEFRFCDPALGGSTCVELCSALGKPTEDCHTGAEILGNVVAKVDNPSASHTAWTASAIRHDTALGWGTAMLEDGGWLYFYGTRGGSNGTDLVVARVRPASVLSPSAWRYRIANRWRRRSSGPTPSELDTVASNVGAIQSVHKVTRRGLTRYLLVHGHAVGDHFLHARVSTSRLSFPALSRTTPRLDLQSIDSSIQLMILGRWLAGTCTSMPGKPVSDFRECGSTYHVRGHQHLSWQDEHGISGLLFSYIVPSGADPSVNHGAYYRPKFSLLPLDNLSPWCTQAGGQCWAGIANQFTKRSLAQAQQWIYGFDVSQADEFYASIVDGSGDPDLYVKFGGVPTTTSYDCRPYTGGYLETCQLTVPPGATSAWVMVRGYSASTFSLRTHHEGE